MDVNHKQQNLFVDTTLTSLFFPCHTTVPLHNITVVYISRTIIFLYKKFYMLVYVFLYVMTRARPMH